jgi:radical SAM superfamily enzyme YgiQ (UPF0313 family)
MPLKILLVNPWNGEVFPPPALGYLQAVLKQAGHNTTAIDMTEANLTWAAVRNWDLVCVTFHSFSVQHAAKLRSYFRGLHMVCGGHHPTALPQQLLDVGYDQVVTGQGENAILEIAAGRRERVIQGTQPDLNALPVPDYTGFSGDWNMGMPVISSRGCAFDCNFCASKQFWQRRWHMRSATNVVEELLALPHRRFMFEDDNFTLHRGRVLEICKALREAGGYHWQCASRAETLNDDELCWNLRSAGCHTVWLGVESFSQASLDRCRKNTTVERMLGGIARAKAHGLEVMCQFIVGLPDDTAADIAATVATIRSAKLTRWGANILWLLPATEAYTRAKAAGFDDDVYLRSGAPFYTYEHDINTLQKWAKQITAA